MVDNREAIPAVWVGMRVQWTVGAAQRHGQVIDIYASGTTSGLSVRCKHENDRVLVIQQRDGKVLLKLESDIKEG